MSHLPDFQPVGVKWINAPIWWKARRRTSVYPPIKKYKEYLILDECLGKDLLDKSWTDNYWFRFWICIPGRLKIKVWKKEDHPNIRNLPKDAPRAVRRLYNSDFQLSLLRATDCDNYFKAVGEAEIAWKKYVDNVLRINKKGNIMNDKVVQEAAPQAKEETLDQIMVKALDKKAEAEKLQTPEVK